MDSLFPFVEEEKIESTVEELEMFKEYDWNFDSNDFILENGKSKVLEGNEALKTWIHKVLIIIRNKYIIYSEDYGHELESLIGQTLNNNAVTIETQRLLEECLLVNPYIKSIDNLSVEFDGDILKCTFTANTIYGNLEVSF